MMIFIGGFIIGFVIGLISHIFMVLTHDTIKLTPTIPWYPYPEIKPITSEHILVTLKGGEDDYEVRELDYGVAQIEAEEEKDEYWQNILNLMTAWAFMPEPYKEKKQINGN